MEGILIPIGGVLISGLLGVLCAVVPRLRQFLLAAVTSPFLTSVVMLLGGFILEDMSPAREYGAYHIPAPRGHDPTKLDYGFYVFAILVTFVVSSAVAYGVQRLCMKLVESALGDRSLGLWFAERDWFGLAG